MKYLVDKNVDLSLLIENQFPQYVREDSSAFIKFLKSYYESQELKNQPLDIAKNLIEYYNVSHYRPSELIKSTNLTTAISSTDTTITVNSTVGFPDKGYISVDDEIVYYSSKTRTQFLNCVRGTTALVLNNIPYSEVTLTSSISDSHDANTDVVNIAYEYTSEFLRRIKSEIAVGIPENLVEELNIASFLSKVRTFYASKGSLNSHKILFRIIFNDKKIRFKLKPRGTGAEIKIINFDGKVGNAQVLKGGSGYDFRIENGALLNPPIIEIFGSGTGQVTQLGFSNTTAIINVTNIESVGTGINNLGLKGTIKEGSTIDPNYNGITIVDPGQNYVGPISAFVRERDFEEEQYVRSISGNGAGIVESWDFNTGELTLTNIIGFFTNADELYSDTGEKARGYVQSFEVISQDPEIEFPKDYLFSTSESDYSGKKIARIEVIFDSLEEEINGKIISPSLLTLIQEEDKIFGVQSVSIESSQVLKIDNIEKPTYEIDIDINDDFEKIYLPASTVLTHNYTVGDTVITVDDASGFPVTEGILYIDGNIVEYSERTSNQFFECVNVQSSGNKLTNVEVVSYGRYKTRRQYSTNEWIEIGNERYYGDNLYAAKTTGYTTTIVPTHNIGTKKIGDIEWEYIGSSKVLYFMDAFVGTPEINAIGNENELKIIVDSARKLKVGQLVIGSGIAVGARIRSISGKEVTLSLPNTSLVSGSCIFSSAKVRVLAVSSEIEIEHGGSLYSDQIYKFDSKLYKDFEGIEYKSWNINSNHVLDADKDFIGVTSVYDYTKSGTGHVYVSSSGIPPYTSSKNRTLKNAFDGYTNAFTIQNLTPPIDVDSIFIFRNAVLQDSGTDFFVVNDSLSFTTVPRIEESVNVRYFDQSNKVTKLAFSQGSSSTEVQVLTTDTIDLTVDHLFISLNGVLQVGNSFTWNDTTKTITFSQNVDVNVDDLLVFWIKSCTVLDTVTSTASSTYTITSSGSAYTSASTNSVFVAVNGVVQTPTTSYTITGSTIEFSEINSGVPITIIDCGSNLKSTSLASLNGVNLDRNNYKLQKLVKRIPFPSSILNKNILRKSKSLSPVESKKATGITVDGIQIQSPKGNKVEYGAVKALNIVNSGTYFVPYDSNEQFDKQNYPQVLIKKNGDEPTDNIVSEQIIDIAASFAEINLNNANSTIINSLSGYSVKPTIQVINNNQTDPENFKDAILDIGYKNGNIDSFIIVEPGYGYLEKPTIRISGGGKFTTYDLPFVNPDDGEFIVRMSGPIISAKSSSQTIELTPQIGSGYYGAPPAVIINSGTGAVISASVANGKIVAVQILNGGSNYYVEPKITINGTGTGAILRPILGNGKIVDVQIVQPGTGYIIPPALVVTPPNTDARVESVLNTWTFNITNRFITGIDEYGGYVFDEQDGYKLKVSTYTIDSLSVDESVSNLVVGMEAIHPNIPVGTFITSIDTTGPSNKIFLSTNTLDVVNKIKLENQTVLFVQGDDRIRGSLKVAEVVSANFPESRLKYQYLQIINSPKFEQYYNISSTNHSPIVGWSYDGHPIYCKYGYTTPLNKTSGISEQTSSWRIRGIRVNGPSINDYPLGSFIEDYEYVEGLGTLDKSNGRFCVTPEFPDGAYCYFIVDQFPHIIGPNYFSDPDCYNLSSSRTNDKIPFGFTRLNDVDNDFFPEEIKNINQSLMTTSYTSVGPVDGIYIENAGKNYKVGDYLVFDNADTSGSGATAYVSAVAAPPVTSVAIDENNVEFTLSGNHNIAKNDVVYIDYKKDTSISFINLDVLTQVPQTLNGKQVFSLTLQKHKKYRLTFGSSKEYNLSFDILNFNPYHQRDINITSSYIDVDPDLIPSLLYIHTDSAIFEIRIVSSDIIGRYVVDASTTTTFTIKTKTIVSNIDLQLIDFAIRSKGSRGPIKTVNVVSGGAGYRVLPGVIGVESETGSGAILQALSSSIGSLKRVEYINYGDKFYGSRNVRSYLKTPITVKVKSNFEIDTVTITNRGSNYFLNPYYRVNGSSTSAKFDFRYSVGEVVDVTVIDGGSGFSTEPTIELFSQNGGTGAKFQTTIKRRSLFAEDFVTLKSKTARAKILNCDTRSSTLELLVEDGEFEVNDTILSSDGREYGVIIEVNDSRAFSKAHPYGDTPDKFRSSLGFVSDDYQRIHDSKYYQNWSYSIVNERNTKEWRSEVLENTHPSGFRLFGKKRIHSRKSIIGRSQNLVRSAVTFKASISNLLDLSVETPLCTKQIIWIEASPNPYAINDLIYGTQSESIARVIEVGDNYLIALLLDTEYEINEYIINLLKNIQVNTISTTDRTLLFMNGILQSQGVDYRVSSDNIIPTFPVFPQDELTAYFTDTPFNKISGSGVNNGNQINLSVGGLQFYALNRDYLIISLNGVIQKTSNFELINGGRTVRFTNSTVEDKPNFILYHESLVPITFSGSSGTTFDLGFTPVDNCNLLIFFEGVSQSHLLTDYTVSGSTIIFPQTVNPSEIFGWYIDEPVECQQIPLSGISQHQVKGKSLICNQEKNVTLEIFSDNIKKPNGFFELEKETLDGTLYADGTNIYGFGSRFRYSNPEYSTSYVEALNDISYLFNGSTQTFNLTIGEGKNAYTPLDGKHSLGVTLNGVLVKETDYSINGTQITFTNPPASGVKCSIKDYVSAYKANYSTKYGAQLDQFNVFNGIRDTFNLSDNGVPETIANQADVFSVRNGILQKPNIHLNAVDSRTNPQIQSVFGNKITYLVAPQDDESMKLMSFNRQLVPENHRNWVLDRNEYFDGVRTTFTLLWSYDRDCDDLVGEDPSTESLVVIRNGVYQYPTTDYVLIAPTDPNDINDGIGSYRIQFAEPVKADEDVFIMFTENNPAVFEDRTDELSQNSPTVLSYTTTVSNGPTMVPFVYIDGVYQDQNSFTWDSLANTLTFSEPVDLTTREVEFHAKLGTLNPEHVYTDILNAWLVILQRGHNEVFVPTVSNTYDVVTRTGTVTISGTDVVEIQQRSGTLTIGSNNYRITNLNLNGSIMFDDPSNTFVSFGGVIQEPGVAYDHSGTGTGAGGIIGDGLKYSSMSIPQGVGYLTAIDIVEFDEVIGRQRSTDEINQVQDGIRTRFRLSLDGIKYTNYTAHEDIIVSRNGVIQHPGVDYTLSNPSGVLLDPQKGCIDFATAPESFEEIWMVGMWDNELIDLTPSTPQVYSTSRTLTATEQEGLIVIQNGNTHFSRNRGYEFSANNEITFAVQTDSNWTQVPFGILTTSGKILDSIDTPYDNSRVEFNMFLDEENFIPTGTYENDALIDPRSIFVTKNGVILTPYSDYNVTGTIDSRIIFTNPPAPGDDIFIKTHGMVKELQTIIGNGSTTYTLSYNSSTFYPNSIIDRPREYENQMVVIRNGLMMDPLKDYYVFNDKIVFTNALSGTVRVLEYNGDKSDIDVDSYSQQVNVGELIQIPGESLRREVTAVISPTYMVVTDPIGNVKPSGFAATTAVVNGKLDSINVTSGGIKYPRNMVLKTYGLGDSAIANTYIDPIRGNVVLNNVSVGYHGWNIINPTLVPTYEAFVVRDHLLNSSNVCFGTKLTSDISDTDETLDVRGTSMAFASDIQIQIVSDSGSNAVLQPFVVSGKLVKVEVENGGIGYNDLDIVLNVLNGGGSGAVLEPILDAMGTVIRVDVTNEGIGYDSYRAFVNNEVIEYTTKNTTQLKGVTRGVIGSAAAALTDDRVLFAECEQP